MRDEPDAPFVVGLLAQVGPIADRNDEYRGWLAADGRDGLVLDESGGLAELSDFFDRGEARWAAAQGETVCAGAPAPDVHFLVGPREPRDFPTLTFIGFGHTALERPPR